MAQNIDTDALARALMLGIESRGRDAAGVAWNDGDDVWLHKDGRTASSFAPSIETNGARAAIIHTRAATKGTKTRNVNNHPVENNGVIGVHNGVIWNDDELFDMLGCDRNGQVDSEAAFALLAHYDELADEPYEVLPLIEGSAALAWLHVYDEPSVVHLARVSSSPLVVAQTRLGSLLFASTRSAIQQAAMRCGFRVKYVNDIPEGSYLRVRDGRITDVRRFEVPKRRFTPMRRAVEARAQGAIATSDASFADRDASDEYDYETWWNDAMLRGLV
jgi:glucosamine 6-phosphate synthetase-like amidotransferase/phosphosugar isomerase protein